MKILRFLFGDRWRPVTDGKTWGIYHPWRWHDWGYGMTKTDAVAECRRMNAAREQPGIFKPND